MSSLDARLKRLEEMLRPRVQANANDVSWTVDIAAYLTARAKVFGHDAMAATSPALCAWYAYLEGARGEPPAGTVKLLQVACQQIQGAGATFHLPHNARDNPPALLAELRQVEAAIEKLERQAPTCEPAPRETPPSSSMARRREFGEVTAASNCWTGVAEPSRRDSD